MDDSQDLGAYVVHVNRPVTKSEFIRRIGDVSLDDIKAIMKRTFGENNFALTIWGDKRIGEQLIN